MTDFEKHQIRRQALNDQLPLKLVNYLDFEQHIIKQGFTTKSRFVLPKSEQKIFPIDDEFRNAFNLFSLDEKVNYYSKQIIYLSNLYENGGMNFETQTNLGDNIRIICKVKGKSLGAQWQSVTATLIPQKCIVEIPHKSGLFQTDLHDYLVREGADDQNNQIILEAIRPNIIKYWRLSFENNDLYTNAFRLITAMADRSLKKRLQDDIRNFQQSRIMNSKTTLKKKSQIDFPKPSFLDASKFSSQVFQINTSVLPVDKQKKTVNFQTQNISSKRLQGRQQTSIIDILSVNNNVVRVNSPPNYIQLIPPQNIFDTDEDWFIKIMAEGYVCSTLYGGKDPDSIFNSVEKYNVIFENGKNRILEDKKDNQSFRLQTKLKFPRDLVLAAFCELDKWPLWNNAVQQAVIKLRVPTSNLLVCKIRTKQLNPKFRPRQILFMFNFFVKNQIWYLMIASVKDSYHPVEDDSIRAKITKALIRFKQNSSGGTIVDMVIDIKQSGDLNPNQQKQLTQRFLMGIFGLQPCLKDRVFVESKANKYFDLQWSGEKFSRFTLGKNNDLDETNSFTSHLCSQICSFYSAQGPEDWSILEDEQQPQQILHYQQRQFSFKKKKNPEQSYVGSFPPIRQSKLPFHVPIENNKVVLNEDIKSKIQSYIRQKQQLRLRGTLQSIQSQKSIARVSSKLPLPQQSMYNPNQTISERSQKRNSSFVQMKEVKRQQPTKQSTTSIIQKNESLKRKQSINSSQSITVRSQTQNQANYRNSQSSNYDILPKKPISKIQIEKYNPDDHIVPFWEPLIYPDSGLIILPNDYLQKWVSIVPITPKKIRSYKGDNWDHFLFRDLWTVLPNGDLKCVNQAKLDMQSSAIKLVLKRFASNVMSGKGILNVSLPVQIFSELSCLELIARSLCFAPFYLQKAAKNSDPIERFKFANAFSIATSLLYIEMQKPFNPILGQTYQGWIAGCPIYCQQISHHPPISAFYLVGKGYTISGRLEPTIDLSLNSGVGWNQGQFTISFTDYPNCSIRTQSPPGQITGLAYGDRKLSFTGKSYAYDQSGLFIQFIFNPTKKGMLSFGKQEKQTDYLKGNLVRVDPSFIKKYKATNSKKRQAPSNKQIIQKICEVEGRWTVGLYFGGVEYMNVLKDQPTMLEQQKYPLNSHANYRQDIYYRRCMKYDLAQSHKQRLQILQRNDKKLREAFHPSKKH